MHSNQWLFMESTGLLLAACDVQKPGYLHPERPMLYNTVSSDGKLVATLQNMDSQNPRLRIKWLHTNEPWQELPAPMYTNSIRLGLNGYELLMANDLPDDMSVGQLTRWDARDPNVTNKGIFWVHKKIPVPDPMPKHPELLSFPLPECEAPSFDVTRLRPDENVDCDNTVERCLRICVAGSHTSFKNGAEVANHFWSKAA